MRTNEGLVEPGAGMHGTLPDMGGPSRGRREKSSWSFVQERIRADRRNANAPCELSRRAGCEEHALPTWKAAKGGNRFLTPIGLTPIGPIGPHPPGPYASYYTVRCHGVYEPAASASGWTASGRLISRYRANVPLLEPRTCLLIPLDHDRILKTACGRRWPEATPAIPECENHRRELFHGCEKHIPKPPT